MHSGVGAARPERRACLRLGLVGALGQQLTQFPLDGLHFLVNPAAACSHSWRTRGSEKSTANSEIWRAWACRSSRSASNSTIRGERGWSIRALTPSNAAGCGGKTPREPSKRRPWTSCHSRPWTSCHSRPKPQAMLHFGHMGRLFGYRRGFAGHLKILKVDGPTKPPHGP